MVAREKIGSKSIERERERERGQHRLGEATCIYKGDFTFLGIFSVSCLMGF